MKHIICGLLLLIITSNALTAQNRVVADSALKVYYNLDNKITPDKINTVYSIASNHTNADTVLKYSEKLIYLARNHDSNEIYLIKGYYYLGIAYNQKGNYEHALKAFFQSAQTCEQSNHKKYLNACYIAIGDVYNDSQNTKQAIKYYNKAINLAYQLNDSLMLAGALLNAGIEYLDIENLDSAFTYFNRSRKIFDALNNEIGSAYSLGNLGKIYCQQGNLSLAEQNISNAVATLEKYNDTYALSIYYRYLADIYKKRNESSPALAYAQISLDIAQHANLLPQVRDAYDILTELYKKEGDIEKAFECQSKFIALGDSINNDETIRKMADLRTEYEVAQKQAEVDFLNKQRRNQRIIVISLLAVLILSIGIFSVYFTNMNKRKKLTKKLMQRQQELQKQKTELQELNKTKDKFFSIISHDLRGPINVLNGTTLLIRDFLDSKNYDELEELTVNMEYSVKKVQNLLDNLLEWAVSQQGEFPYKPERLDMDDICENVLNIFVTMAATKSIDITYEIKSNARFIFADRNSLMTIIRNLVSNAIKFTDKDGAVQILAQRKEDTYCLTISDSGVGIETDRIKSIFKLDDNKSTWGTNKEKGLGIGLSLVYEFVKMNKGTISVDSTPGVGTSFNICLPQQEENNKNSKTPEKKSLIKA